LSLKPKTILGLGYAADFKMLSIVSQKLGLQPPKQYVGALDFTSRPA
jgi:hypothetical protein